MQRAERHLIAYFMKATRDNLTHGENFRVLGNNWANEVSLSRETLDGMEPDQVVAEAATAGVEKFLRGEYETGDIDEPVGFGPIFNVIYLKTKRSWAVPSPAILANAGAFSEAREVQEFIDKNK